MLLIRTILLLMVFTLPPSSLLAQTKSQQKEAIREVFQQINNDRSLKKVALENEAFLEHMTDGGGELTGFYKDGQLVKVRVWVGLSDGNKVVEFYFKDGALQFVYGQFSVWVYNTKRDEFDHSKTKINFEGRYYFQKQKLIDKIEKGNMHVDDEAYYQEKNLLTAASNYSTILNKNK